MYTNAARTEAVVRYTVQAASGTAQAGAAHMTAVDGAVLADAAAIIHAAVWKPQVT